ncbi:hypothetical protein V8E53_004552 [Lactarius tabidus]
MAPLNFKIAVPKAIGRRGNEGHNPEQIFAVGYSGEFESLIPWYSICIHVHVTLPPSPLITASGHETLCATNGSDSDQPHPGTDATLLPLVPTALNVTPLEPSALDSNLDFAVPPTPTKVIPLRRKWRIFARKKPSSGDESDGTSFIEDEVEDVHGVDEAEDDEDRLILSGRRDSFRIRRD